MDLSLQERCAYVRAMAQNSRECGATCAAQIAALRLNLMVLPPTKLHELWEVTLLTTMEMAAAQAEPRTYQQQAEAISAAQCHKLLSIVINEVDQILVLRSKGPKRFLGATAFEQRPRLPPEVRAQLKP